MTGAPAILTLPRLLLWVLGATLLTLAIAICAPLVGGGISLPTALTDNPFGREITTPDGLIFWQTRLPRVLSGLVTGAALGAAGVVFQAVLRNPLAEPYVLGISAGAAVGKAVAVLLLPPAATAIWVASPLLCFAGGLLPLLYLGGLAVKSRRMQPETLLLAGVMLNIIISALLMLFQALARPDQARQLTWWFLGGLETVGYEMPLAAGAVCLPGFAVLMLRSRQMNLLSVDPATASHLGINVRRETWLLLGTGALLASAAVAVAGPIGFVGLLVPHLLRSVAGPDHRLLVPLSIIAGAGFMVLCDLAGWRGLQLLQQAGLGEISSQEIPAGVITALLGGPVFLWMLGRR